MLALVGERAAYRVFAYIDRVESKPNISDEPSQPDFLAAGQILMKELDGHPSPTIAGLLQAGLF
jgi:hypothetical protein